MEAATVRRVGNRCRSVNTARRELVRRPCLRTSSSSTSQVEEIGKTPTQAFRRPNPFHPVPGLSAAQLAQAHSLLSPPPTSALSALAARIPGFPLELNHPTHLGAVEQCLTSPSFWKGIEEGDVALDDLKKAVSRWVEPKAVREPSSLNEWEAQEEEPQQEQELFLPGRVMPTTAPDQSMDASPAMQPPGSKRRAELRKQRRMEVRNDLVPEDGWKEAVPQFTNFLDEGRLDNEAYAVLGNSVLGLLASEWLDAEHPNLPSKRVAPPRLSLS